MQWLTRWLPRNFKTSSLRRSSHFRPRLESLEDRTVPTVLNYGGNVLPHVEAQALFYGSAWATSAPLAAQTPTLNAFLTDLTGGAYMDALTRAGYGAGRGSATPGAVDGIGLAPNSVVTDASIQARLQADIKSGLLLQVPDSNRLYIVYVEPNVAVNLGAGQGTTQQGILGYHGAFAGTDAAGNPKVIRYAVVAYPGGTVGNSSLGTSAIDQQTSVTSHELAEAVTDPDVNFGRLGWYDPRRGEIGDVTENNSNAYVRLDGYLVQEVAAQNDQLLSIFTATPPAPTITTATTTTLTASAVNHPKNGPATAKLTITISSGAGAVPAGGVVELIYNGQVLGTGRVVVVNGVSEVVFNVAFFQSGAYSFTAQYLGSSSFQGSSSGVVRVTV